MALAKNRFNDAENTVKVTNLLPQKLVTKGKVTLAKGQEAVVVKMMVDGQYAEPIVALVRELISNGLDAVAALEGLRPGRVEVTAPSALSPQFVVKDNGVGMTLEEVVANYATLLGSLKGDDLSQIGAYGLGAKAPLAYTTSFVIRTVKDGMRTIFTLSCGDEGYDYDVMEHVATTEESGTTVTVPVRSEDIYKFEEALAHYRGMPSSTSGATITCNGKPFTDDSKWVHYTDVVLDPDSGLTGRVLLGGARVNKVELVDTLFRTSLFGRNYLIGGYCYNYNSFNNTHVLVELVPGVVDFTTSRDSIVTNDRFYELEARVKEAQKNASVKVFRELLLSLTPDELLKLQNSWNWQHCVTLEGDKVVLTTALGKLSLKVEDFTLPHGGNIFRYQQAARDLDAYYRLNLGSNYASFTHTGKAATADSTMSDSGVNACMKTLTTQVAEDSSALVSTAKWESLFSVFTSSLLLLEEVDDEVVKAFRRERSHLLADHQLKNIVLFLKGTLPATFAHEHALLQKDGLSQVEVLSKAAFLKLAAESKEAHKRIAAPREKKETYPFHVLLEKAPALEELTETDLSVTEVQLSPQELLAAEDTLLLFRDGVESSLISDYGKQEVLKTLYGLGNNDVIVEGKRVVTFHPSDLPSPLARKLGTADHSYPLVLDTSYHRYSGSSKRTMSLSHKWVKEKLETAPLPSTHYLKKVSEEELCSFMLLSLKTHLRWWNADHQPKFLERLKVLLPGLEEGPLAEVASLLVREREQVKKDLTNATVPDDDTLHLLLAKAKGEDYATAFFAFRDLGARMREGYFRTNEGDLQFLSALLFTDLSPLVDQAELLKTAAPLLQEEVAKVITQEG